MNAKTRAVRPALPTTSASSFTTRSWCYRSPNSHLSRPARRYRRASSSWRAAVESLQTRLPLALRTTATWRPRSSPSRHLRTARSRLPLPRTTAVSWARIIRPRRSSSPTSQTTTTKTTMTLSATMTSRTPADVTLGICWCRRTSRPDCRPRLWRVHFRARTFSAPRLVRIRWCPAPRGPFRRRRSAPVRSGCSCPRSGSVFGIVRLPRRPLGFRQTISSTRSRCRPRRVRSLAALRRPCGGQPRPARCPWAASRAPGDIVRPLPVLSAPPRPALSCGAHRLLSVIATRHPISS